MYQPEVETSSSSSTTWLRNMTDQLPPVYEDEHFDLNSYYYWNISLQKWIAMFMLTFSSIIFGLLPYFLFNCSSTSSPRQLISTSSASNKRWFKGILEILSSISGGVLLATTMLHILPEVREKAKSLIVLHPNDSTSWLSAVDKGYPVAEMLALYGFCLIYFLEVLAHFLIPTSSKSNDKVFRDPHHHPHLHHSHQHQHHGYELSLQSDDQKSYEKFIPVSHSDDGISSNSSEDCGSQSRISKPLGVSVWRSLISLMALSFHAVMEGVAVGVQDSSDLWMAFGAVASHKLIISFCLGMELMKSHVHSVTLVGAISIFSIVSPLGIFIGSTLTAAEELTDTGSLVILEGLACGTLLYVVFFEILTSDRHNSHDSNGTKSVPNAKKVGLIQFLSTFGGILITGYMMGTHEHHEHDHHDHH